MIMDEIKDKNEQDDNFDPDKLLEVLFKKHRDYFTNERYTAPTSRYEAWLMASYLSNMKIAKTLENIFNRLERLLSELPIFQNRPDKPIIKEEKAQESAPGLRRRRRE
uniref:Uncharacterized protein n=1 Tax=viral metagenome TaxID=1070528 RepID=A0A6H1ZS29_9ZZZZ